jgi:hypothetical protein
VFNANVFHMVSVDVGSPCGAGFTQSTESSGESGK